MEAGQDLPGRKVERAGCKRPQRLSRASRRGDGKTARTLQRRVLQAWDARLLATRRVTQDNRGKNTAGVDGVQALTPSQRLQLSPQLTLALKATPVRRVWIATPGTAAQRP